MDVEDFDAFLEKVKTRSLSAHKPFGREFVYLLNFLCKKNVVDLIHFTIKYLELNNKISYFYIPIHLCWLYSDFLPF